MSNRIVVTMTADERDFLLMAVAMVKHETEHPTVAATLRAGKVTEAPGEAGDEPQGWREQVLDVIRNGGDDWRERALELLQTPEGDPIPDPDPTGEYPDGWHPATNHTVSDG